MKKTSFILIAILILSTGFKAGVAPIDINARIKAVFIYNFAKYIEWPKSYREGAFVVGVVGNAPLYDNLSKMSLTKKVASQTLRVKKYNSISDVDKCHILFIAKNSNQNFNEVVKKMKNNSTLIVTEQPGMVNKGAGINFVVRNNRQKFELNKANVEKYRKSVV